MPATTVAGRNAAGDRSEFFAEEGEVMVIYLTMDLRDRFVTQ